MAYINQPQIPVTASPWTQPTNVHGGADDRVPGGRVPERWLRNAHGAQSFPAEAATRMTWL